MAEYLMYTGAALDRAAALRRDEGWVADRLDDGATQIVPVWRGRNLIAGGDCPRAVTITGSPARALVRIAEGVAILGIDGEVASFAADVSAHDEAALAPLQDGAEFIDLRQAGALMERRQGMLLAYARGIVYWHHRHRFCGDVGSECGHDALERVTVASVGEPPGGVFVPGFQRVFRGHREPTRGVEMTDRGRVPLVRCVDRLTGRAQQRAKGRQPDVARRGDLLRRIGQARRRRRRPASGLSIAYNPQTRSPAQRGSGRGISYHPAGVGRYESAYGRQPTRWVAVWVTASRSRDPSWCR